MNISKKIILCQPDNRKGCCACCGIFNLSDISKGSLEEYLIDSENRIAQSGTEINNLRYHNIKTDKRDITSYICAYQGFVKSNPGCLLHPVIKKWDMRDISLFGSKICSDFLCPAHELLSDKLKNILINNIIDWYCYSIAIIDPESLTWIVETLEGDFGIQFKGAGFEKGINILLTGCLKLHSEYLNRTGLPVFYYSIPEYSMNRQRFSLSSDSDKINNHRKEMKETMERLIRRFHLVNNINNPSHFL